jgi:hypothetical protein
VSYVAGYGDVDALKMIESLEGDPMLRKFLSVIFNYELDKGAAGNFAYKEAYRSVVSKVALEIDSLPEDIA